MAWIGKVERPTQISWSSSANHCKHPVCLMCTSQRIAPSCFSGLGHMQALKKLSWYIITFGYIWNKYFQKKHTEIRVTTSLLRLSPKHFRHLGHSTCFSTYDTLISMPLVSQTTTDRRLYPSRQCSHSAHFPQLTSQSTMASNKKTPGMLIQWWKKSCTWDV